MEDARWSTRLSTIQTIHWAVAATLILFSLIVLYMNSMQPMVAPGKAIDYLLYVPILTLVATVPISGLVYNQLLKKKTHGSLEEKFKVYQSAILIRDAFFELPGLLTCIVAYLLGNNFILVIIPVVILLFYANRPTINKMRADLRLSASETQQIGP